MERQRTLSLKPTRLLLFSITLLSSLLICLFFYSFVLSSYSFVLHETTHIQLRPLLETAVDERFIPTKQEALEERTDLASTQQAKTSNSKVTHIREPLSSSGEDPNSNIETKDSILEETHFSESVDSTDEGGESNKVEPFPLLQLREGARTTGSGTWTSLSRGAGKIEKEKMGSCDVYKGRWVLNESYPLYTNETCPYIDEGFSCQSNGRSDRDYMKWRWQPSDCDLPRFDPKKMLELLRGKRLVFAGDSINRNQWESLLCMLRQGISDPKRMYEARKRRITKSKGVYNFKFPDYQCSVEFYVSHFLVSESSAKVGRRRVPTLRIDSVDRSSARWRGADILVFNSAHWWSHYKTQAGRNYFQEGAAVHPKLDVDTAFEKALSTWASWIDQNIDPRKTTVFYRSSSPSHFSGGEWDSGGHCRESTRPLNTTMFRRPPKMNEIVYKVMNRMKTPVNVLNITAMSGLRIDGHPSIYGMKPGLGASRGVQDCSHWCLPGVPDVWNELLYYSLLSKQKSHSID